MQIILPKQILCHTKQKFAHTCPFKYCHAPCHKRVSTDYDWRPFLAYGLRKHYSSLTYRENARQSKADKIINFKDFHATPEPIYFQTCSDGYCTMIVVLYVLFRICYCQYIQASYSKLQRVVFLYIFFQHSTRDTLQSLIFIYQVLKTLFPEEK